MNEVLFRSIAIESVKAARGPDDTSSLSTGEVDLLVEWVRLNLRLENGILGEDAKGGDDSNQIFLEVYFHTIQSKFRNAYRHLLDLRKQQAAEDKAIAEEFGIKDVAALRAKVVKLGYSLERKTGGNWPPL